MKVLIMEKNLIMLSRIKNSLSGHEVNANAEYSGEDVVFINAEAFPVDKIKELKSKGAKVIAYCSHKNLKLQSEAMYAGADLVIPNSQVVDAGRILDRLKP